ncbi:MAG TPA: beta-ketoacyl synthase N-terminal-like domain-containing protein [Mycobacterium sp.]|nr:beta-ketoacyl synthase N-terminal-like domain-containing protein [Mycobacterium sp.]
MARDRSLDIAVTGISARFPGCSSIDEWWSALLAGRVLTTRYERQALLDAGVPAGLIDDPDYIPVRAHLDDADRFDAAFFHLSPREVELMDPQHRLMLEVAWNALEDAGIAPRNVPLTTGVYASMTGSSYARSLLAGRCLDPLVIDQVIHGCEPDFMAGRIAYKLGLTGPAMAVQTACSSSLVGVHLAVQGLLNGDCDQALVVGAGIAFPQAGYLRTPGGLLSASGCCRPFDARADGVVAGSGVACVVLRRLADAVADDCDSYGVILGTAINNDGGAKAGFYAPSVTAQQALIRTALDTADVDGSTIGYLETHGTGTRIGDPIEWSAASAALAAAGARRVTIGALKANVGHLDAAAGVAALIKALLVTRRGVVPPVAGFGERNALLDEGASPLSIPTAAHAWTGPQPRRAGVSAFGIGGTNAHVIVEQSPERDPLAERHDTAELVLLSAADQDALTRSAARLESRLREDAANLDDVCFTLAVGRSMLSERLAVAGRTGGQVAERLATGLAVTRGSRPAAGAAPVVFLFPGQGAQHPGMALPFTEALPGFSSALETCLDEFDDTLAARLDRVLLDPQCCADELANTDVAQPALFAVEAAAAAALMSLGLVPAAVLGHSLGEVTAVHVAGVLDLHDACAFVTERGGALQACPPGAMLAVGCGETRTRQLLSEYGPDLDLAAVNAPDNCVVAGAVETVAAFHAWLGDRVFSQLLPVTRAFHSALIEPALPQLRAALASPRLRPPSIPLAANVDGCFIQRGEPISAQLLVEQARLPVRFAAAVNAIAQQLPGAVVLEVGPGRTLTTMAEVTGLNPVAMSPRRRADHAAAEDVLAALGHLWVRGQPVDAASICRRGRRIHLPGYPFAGSRWAAPEPDRAPAPVPTISNGAPNVDANGSAPQPGALVAALWAELLGQADLTDDSDFFALGGDSLLITRLARRVNQELGVQVPLRALLVVRTLGRQSALIDDLANSHGQCSGEGVDA